eukprot:scaffold5589_cov115-Isochrysis_galbana.AAC.4
MQCRRSWLAGTGPLSNRWPTSRTGHVPWWIMVAMPNTKTKSGRPTASSAGRRSTKDKKEKESNAFTTCSQHTARGIVCLRLRARACRVQYSIIVHNRII